MPNFARYKPGFEIKTLGWTFTIETDRHIRLECGTLKDIGTVLPASSPRDDLIVEYSTPEKIPGTVRTTVKMLFRKILARQLEEA